MTDVFDPAIADSVVDVTLIGDPLQVGELRDPGVGLIDDRDIGANRIVVRRMLLPGLSDDRAVVVAFEVEFHPADQDNRFESADLTLILKEPGEARFLDLEPKSLTEGEAVTLKRTESEGLNVTLWGAIGGNLVSQTEVSYSSYHTFLQGSGATTRRARWSLTENPLRGGGIPLRNRFVVSLTRLPQLRAELMVNVRLIRPGLGQMLETIRRLIPPARTIPFDLGLD